MQKGERQGVSYLLPSTSKSLLCQGHLTEAWGHHEYPYFTKIRKNKNSNEVSHTPNLPTPFPNSQSNAVQARMETAASRTEHFLHSTTYSGAPPPEEVLFPEPHATPCTSQRDSWGKRHCRHFTDRGHLRVRPKCTDHSVFPLPSSALTSSPRLVISLSVPSMPSTQP